MVKLGPWQIRGCLGDEWQWHLRKPWDAPHWLPARVPGSVMDDLMRAGELPDLYHGRNSRLAEWAPERAWIYRTRFRTDLPALRFEGVDYACTVFVDGEELAHHESCFRPFDVDVSRFADGAEHLLAVVVHPAPENEPQVGRTSRVRVHKPRMNYGWDFCPRLVHQGIWRDAYLHDGSPEPFPHVRLEDGVGSVEIDGEVVFRIDEPRLWWPNGMGEQHLYEVDGFHVGFRTVDLRDDYTLVVNGRETYVKGWNWCPIDPLYGVPRPERLRHLLELAAAAHANLLRVWGGGLLESHAFYEHCDRLGLLVWQEFSQSSSGIESVPSEDPEFVSLLVEEARDAVPRLRRHPSLAIWCGGNELARPRPDRDDVPLDDATSPVLRALHDVVEELHPEAAWLPTSPSGPRFLNRLDLIAEDPDGQHDVHGPWEHQGLRRHYELCDSGTSMLHSEFGVEGMTNRAAFEALVPEEDRWPCDRSNPVYEHLGAWWNNAPLVQECFGGRIEDVDTMRRASQWLQYDGLRYAVEANMRRARSRGVLPWQFNESYPNAWCTAAVDWTGAPKPAYHGVARAYSGAPSARFATCVWGGEREVRIEGSGRIVDLHGNVVAEGDAEIVAPLEDIATDVFLVDLHGANRYVMTKTENLAPLLDLPQATIVCDEKSQGDVLLRNVGDVAAIGIVCGDVIDLLPGESRAVTAREYEGWNVSSTGA